MTTNQTIDGVPRELLERMLDSALAYEHVQGDDLDELRALLDAPACKTCCGQGEIFVSKGKVESHMLTEPEPIYRECPDCKPAAQPQGEPVTCATKSAPELWQVRFFHGENTSTPGWEAWENLTVKYSYAGETIESRVKEIQGYIEQGYKYELRALYAEQPAPVAVVRLGDHHVLGAIHSVEGFPGVTGYQIKTLTDLLNSAITGK